MWCRTFSVPVVLMLALGGCTIDSRTIDVCGRGDRARLADALTGGTLEIEVLDENGDVIARGITAADSAGKIELDFAGGERVRVTGKSASGETVADGVATLDESGACVCLALSPQHAAACGGLSCVVDGTTCRFFDTDTGDAAGIRQITIPAAADTTLVFAEPETPHGEATILGAELYEEVALVTLDLSALPQSAIIDGAWLELKTAPPPAEAPDRFLSVHPVLEPWDAATATWQSRAPGMPWTSPGCGPGSCEAEPWARAAIELSGVTVHVPLGLHLQDWISGSLPNHGLMLRSDGNRAQLISTEGGTPPQLVFDFHLPEDRLPDPRPEPICGNGLVEDGEACDDGDLREDDGCTGCELARCGDGVVRHGVEECEPTGAPDDTCTPLCIDCSDPNAAATWVSPEGICYALFLPPIRRTFRNAENACDDRAHGHLAAFETRAEYEAVLAGLGAPFSSAVWIGLSDRGTEGSFEWVTGQALGAWDAFAAGEPTPEDCVTVEGDNQRWFARACRFVRGFICEREPWIAGENGHAYKAIVGRADDWNSAELACQGAGAHLATVSSEAENAVLAGAAGFELWLGLSEIEAEGTLEWVTGERLEFERFENAPSLENETFCGVLAADGTAWDVEACTRDRRYACEAE